MSIQSLALDAIFGRLGQAATFTPSGGSATSVQVIPRTPDELVDYGQSSVKVKSARFELRLSEAATAVNGVLVFKGDTYAIDEAVSFDKWGTPVFSG